MPSKKQLAARAKFTKMVKAKAAKRGVKKGVKKGAKKSMPAWLKKKMGK